MACSTTLSAKEEGDEEAAQAAVAVEEWVDGLELDVDQGGLDQEWQRLAVVIQEFLELAHGLDEVIWRRRDVGGIAGAGAADPVLGAPEFAWLLAAAATSGQENAVDLPEEAVGERELFELRQGSARSFTLTSN